jgi:hypothetical protein
MIPIKTIIGLTRRRSTTILNTILNTTLGSGSFSFLFSLRGSAKANNINKFIIRCCRTCCTRTSRLSATIKTIQFLKINPFTTLLTSISRNTNKTTIKTILVRYSVNNFSQIVDLALIVHFTFTSLTFLANSSSLMRFSI